MTKYLLIAWKKAIEDIVDNLCRKYKDEDEPQDRFRSVWYYYCKWLDQEIKNGDMVEELRPFAHSFAEEAIRKTLEGYKILRIPKDK